DAIHLIELIADSADLPIIIQLDAEDIIQGIAILAFIIAEHLSVFVDELLQLLLFAGEGAGSDMIELFDLMLQLLYLCIITKSRTDRCLDLKITLNVIGKIADIAG